MKTEFEPEDIKTIAQKVAELLSPLIAKQSTGKDDAMLDVQGLCDYLHVSPKWVYKRTHLKEIPHHKVEGVLLFRKRDIDKWVDGYKIPVLSSSANLKLLK